MKWLNRWFIKEKITIIVADDHQIFLEGIASLFNNFEHIKLLSTCNDGDAFLVCVEDHKPDIALLDLSMSGEVAENIIEIVVQQFLQTKIIVLTMN